MNETIAWGGLVAIVLAIILGAYTYNFKIIDLKREALAQGATIEALECIDPGTAALAGCLLLAQKAQK